MSCRMSVIVPVYNKERYLDGCIACLAAQTAPHDKFEVILVDDGSIDGSLDMCLQFEKQYSFIRVIHQDNKGVSCARNVGIECASGDYIMFLDADDSISADAIENLIASFDSFGETTDVVSYEMRYVYPDTGKNTGHERAKWLTHTGLYYLDDVEFIAQSTMNVCIRNRGESSILFDESLKMGEDQLFITKNLERKATIGYCKEAQYYYVRYPSSASSRYNSPLYAFDDVMTLFEELLAIAQRNVLMRRYAYNLILYNVAWRMKSTKLFPNHLNGDELADAEDRLRNVFRSIPFESYLSNPQLYNYHKAYLFKNYYFDVVPVSVWHTDIRSIVVFDNKYIWRTQKASVVVQRCTYWDGVLNLQGRMIGPSLLLEDRPNLLIRIGDECRPLSLIPSSYDYAMSKNRVAKTWAFNIEFAIQANRPVCEVSFEAAIDGQAVRSMPLSFNPKTYNARVLEKKYYYPFLTVVAKGNTLVIYSRQAKVPKKKFISQDLNDREGLRFRLPYIKAAKEWKNKRLWMYVDLPTSKTEGNALIQLLHDLEMDDGIKRYYISNYGRELVARYPQLDGVIMEMNSEEHRIAALNAEMVLHSYLESFTYMPFSADERKQIGDLMVKRTNVYLQHGVLHAYMPWYFSRDRHEYDRIVVSTRMEHDALIDHYCCSEENILTAGAPRFDKLHFGTNKKRKILFVPSWRAYLVAGTADNRVADEAVFLNSSFYEGVRDLIQLLNARSSLQKSDYTFEIKLHPNFKFYERYFDIDDERISLAADVIDESEYDIVVTDFSSYVYDFIISGSRIVYYLPDSIEFNGWLNHYDKLELPFDEGFGPFCTSAQDACEVLESLMRGDSDTSLYDGRRRDFFYHRDNNNCDRLYKTLMALAEA